MSSLRLRRLQRLLVLTVVVPSVLMPRIGRAQDPTKPPALAPKTSAPEHEEAGEQAESEPPSPEGESEKKEAEQAEGLSAADQAEMEAELEAELAGEDMSRPPPAGKGAVWGVVTDTKFNETIIEGTVQVVGRKEKTLTDVDGRYRLELPPGTYTIRVYFEMHQPARVERIVITQGKVQRVDVSLVPDETAVEEVVIEEEVDRTSTEGQTLQRRRSASVGDGVGRAEIARTPDRNAAEAAQRVVGATIVGSRFVFVRGLGERYTNSLLNGTPLPSPEPDRQTVPLDLFPALVLDSITIAKQFTPDMPADFAGGSVRIFTREFPRQTLFQVSVNGGWLTGTTFRERLSSRTSSTDWLGFDDGRRELPPRSNSDERLDSRDLQGTAAYGRELNSYRSTTRETTPPNHGVSVVAGDAWKIGSDQKLGGIAALTYSRSYQRRTTHFQRFEIAPVDGDEALVRRDFGSGEEGTDNVRWGGFATVTYELSKNHKLGLTGLRSQAATKLDSDIEAFKRNNAAFFRGIHLEYVSRALNFGQLRGWHRFPSLKETELDWHLDLASASRDQPDTRDTLYRRSDPSQPLSYTWSPGTNSGLHFYSGQSELTKSGGLDLTQPIVTRPKLKTTFKAGTLLTSRARDFSARRYVLAPDGRGLAGELQEEATCTGAWDPTCPDRLFRQDNIAPGLLTARETTLQFDEYDAGLDVYAGYGMVDFEVDELRVIGGLRVEATNQFIEAWDPYDRANMTERAEIEQTDYLPAVSLVYATTPKTNTRVGVSQTLARPQLREIAPFSSASYTVDLPTQGETDLKLTKITNVDLRMEYFPTMREVLAFSIFVKHFENPIEEVIIPSSQDGVYSYRNADSARLLGLELEARKNLGVFAEALDDFSVIANLTLVASKVNLGANVGSGTNPSRPLSNQSPYVANLSLDYGNDKSGTDLRLLYNVFGPRIARVGSEELPDIYELPRHTLDFSAAQKLGKHFETKLSVTNILGDDVEFAYRDVVSYRRNGTDFDSLGADPFVSSYKVGRTFTLTGSYTY